MVSLKTDGFALGRCNEPSIHFTRISLYLFYFQPRPSDDVAVAAGAVVKVGPVSVTSPPMEGTTPIIEIGRFAPLGQITIKSEPESSFTEPSDIVSDVTSHIACTSDALSTAPRDNPATCDNSNVTLCGNSSFIHSDLVISNIQTIKTEKDDLPSSFSPVVKTETDCVSSSSGPTQTVLGGTRETSEPRPSVSRVKETGVTSRSSTRVVGTATLRPSPRIIDVKPVLHVIRMRPVNMSNNAQAANIIGPTLVQHRPGRTGIGPTLAQASLRPNQRIIETGTRTNSSSQDSRLNQTLPPFPIGNIDGHTVSPRLTPPDENSAVEIVPLPFSMSMQDMPGIPSADTD